MATMMMRMGATMGAVARSAAVPRARTAVFAPLSTRRFMSDYPADRKYKSSHEWVKVDGDVGVVGITSHAASELGDIVFVDLPNVGDTVDKNGTLAAIESVKAASDIYSPVTGEVVAVNDVVADDPAILNRDAHDNGWLAKIKLSNTADTEDLMDSASYTSSLDS